MLLSISLSNLVQVLGNNLNQCININDNLSVCGINTDSRLIRPGELFIALKGENFDGHNFVAVAVNQGAISLVTERPLSVIFPTDIPQLQVKDSLKAYQQIAHWWRNQFTIPIIGVTGSVGKTTTKELIAAVLGTYGKVHKTQANYNNEIGVPKTLLALTSDHDYGVIEMAMRASGEIALLTDIVCPTIGVITNVGTAHIGRLGSEEAIAIAKCELLAQMPQGAVAILNHDNARLLDTASRVWQGETITYGLEGGDIRGELLDNQRVRVEGMIFPVPLPGRHHALNYLGALAVAKYLKLDWGFLTQGISVDVPKGRSQQYQLPNDVLLLDETYNAGLESMKAALQLLKDTPGKRHIAVLGTMKELGEKSTELHREVGSMAEKLGLDALYILVDDPEAEAIARGVTGIVTQCLGTHEELVETLIKVVKSGDRLLFKASNSVGLNRVVEQFRQQY
ncbi:UDP-N-acetylmuramoyl-tripeptide--D-alanyl-D-alanine ligase [Aphanothece sacrum]|uniref:UDP-N-acetylmuramoyl-tripeptide--D-alanyl-D-alanine ligase n=1 Tax=Aphanothece sacrum FPU1 TaxID=1920663 RepID=A0A401IMW9_APHSA|nr:UDP-N-acetylmuramoyl-tripeptide--D-alanyl-D-alanine ligase [Aphanothece sacrum]GBF82589.1 UDP-N-acetylmuramoyl-tripeptide--D-alanyl-D-alanine ligase [Aphanothece sacrum FPU1]